MYVPAINEVKNHLDELTGKGSIKVWELPYENLLTRLSAAIFFMDATNEGDELLSEVCDELSKYENFSYRLNTEKKLSQMKYRITFSAEEKEKNEQANVVIEKESAEV